MDDRYLRAKRKYNLDPTREGFLYLIRQRIRIGEQINITDFFTDQGAIRTILDSNFLVGDDPKADSMAAIIEKAESYIEEENYEILDIYLMRYVPISENEPKGHFWLQFRFNVQGELGHTENLGSITARTTYLGGHSHKEVDLERGPKGWREYRDIRGTVIYDSQRVSLFHAEETKLPSEEVPHIYSGPCEDFPHCGHDICPPFWSHTGEQVAIACICGDYVPLHSTSSICDRCMRGDTQFDEYDEFQTHYDWEEDPEEDDWY
jgi:hypothetical protein